MGVGKCAADGMRKTRARKRHKASAGQAIFIQFNFKIIDSHRAWPRLAAQNHGISELHIVPHL